MNASIGMVKQIKHPRFGVYMIVSKDLLEVSKEIRILVLYYIIIPSKESANEICNLPSNTCRSSQFSIALCRVIWLYDDEIYSTNVHMIQKRKGNEE
jgi:hypothetical protein